MNLEELQDALDYWGIRQTVFEGSYFKTILDAARLVAEADGEALWLCIDDHGPEGLKVSNLPGGPLHCFFTGGAHYPLCGLRKLVIDLPEETHA